MRDKIWPILGMLAFVTIAIFLMIAQEENNESRIRGWAEENNCKVVEIEHQIFSTGPFWFKNDEQVIYRVELKNHFERDVVSWFRIGPWSFEQEWE